jgi:hypothetical protein
MANVPLIDRLRTRLWLGLASGYLAAAAANAVGNQPQIQVRVEVASTTINDALPNAAARAQAEQALAEYLAKQMGMQFPFVAWTASENATAPMVGQLIARLNEDAIEPMSSISVRWLAVRPPDPVLQPMALARVEVYKKNDPSVASDAKGVQRDTQRALDRVALGDSGFMRDFFTKFVATIPLAVRVTALPAKRVIELPLKGEELPIGQESEMKLEFVKTTAGDPERGLIKLSRFAATESGQLGGGVNQAVVNQTALTLTDNWHPTLSVLLNGAAVQCFLTNYKPDSSVPAIITVPQ